MLCKEKFCFKYRYKACCFFCKDKECCAVACRNDVTVCGRLEEEGEENTDDKVQ